MVSQKYFFQKRCKSSSDLLSTFQRFLNILGRPENKQNTFYLSSHLQPFNECHVTPKETFCRKTRTHFIDTVQFPFSFRVACEYIVCLGVPTKTKIDHPISNKRTNRTNRTKDRKGSQRIAKHRKASKACYRQAQTTIQ